MNLQTLLPFLTSLTLAINMPVLAQYQWIDSNGRKVFSDQPPPPTVPASKVVQQPSKMVIPATLEVVKQADATTPIGAKFSDKIENGNSKTNPPEKKTPNAGKDKEQEAKKKVTDEAEATKKRAEVDKQAAARADNCERAKRAKSSLDSGIRTTITNSKGKHEFMDDAARMVETKRIEGIIASDCKY